MPADVTALLADLAAETASLRRLLDPLADPDWRRPTPAPGWSIADQVTHLAFFDEAAVTAASDPAAFGTLRAGLTDGTQTPDTIAARYRHLAPAEVRDWFERARAGLLAVFGRLDAAARLPWFGPSMSVPSALTARLMETWAHGQDVADAVGVRREPTGRLRHVAHIGVAARPFSYAAHGLPAPADPVRVELIAPSGEIWTWGPEGVRARVTGPVLDFCLVVTQRRHHADTSLVAVGEAAQEWLSIAQAFAGPPGPGRVHGQFPDG